MKLSLLKDLLSSFRLIMNDIILSYIVFLAIVIANDNFIKLYNCYERTLYSLYGTIAVTAFLYYSLPLLLASTLQPSLRVYIDLLSMYILLSS